MPRIWSWDGSQTEPGNEPVSKEHAVSFIGVGATWLHLLATVTLVGYYAVLALFLIPTIRRLSPPGTAAETICAVERRALPLLVAALVVFLATGVYMMGVDSRYGGPGNIGGTWATLLLLKHVVVVVMLGLGSYLDGLIARLVASSVEGTDAATTRIYRVTGGMAVLGAAVLLLTAMAQAG
jgi:uncharacterized membrane protein